jgi:hypothetical protein
MQMAHLQRFQWFSLHLNPTGYDKHSKCNSTYSVQAYQNFPVPLTSIPVTVSPSLNGWEISGPVSQLFWSPMTPTPGNFFDYLKALQPWESSLFHILDSVCPFLHLLIGRKFFSLPICLENILLLIKRPSG